MGGMRMGMAIGVWGDLKENIYISLVPYVNNNTTF